MEIVAPPVIKKNKYSDKHDPTRILNHQQRNNFFWFYTDETILEVRIVSDTIIRFRYAADGFFQKDFSYALADDFLDAHVHIRFREHALKYDITTPSLHCRIFKKNMKVVMYNKKKQVILED